MSLEKQAQKPMSELINFSIINLDKPSGPTSFSVSSFICRELNLNKTSHFGTLDPMVSGVLPIGLGRACRLSDYFMHKNKTYVGIMHIHKEVQLEELNKVIKKFIGKISQLPPIKSRVKREVREREIISFDIIEVKEKDVLFITEVQAGTYIRKLIHDIGEKIAGAHMLELRRTKAGIFDESTAINLYDFERAVKSYKEGFEEPLRRILIPAEEAIRRVLPSIQANEKNIKPLLTGKPLMKQDIKEKFPNKERFALFLKERLIGVYRVSSEGNIIARPEFVFN